MRKTTESPFVATVSQAGTKLAFLLMLLAAGWLIAGCQPIADPAVSEVSLMPRAGDAYRYYVVTEEDGEPRGYIEYDLNNPAAIERYRAANLQSARALLEESAGERIPIQLTFAHPLSERETEILLADAGIEATHYTTVGFTASGERYVSGFTVDGALDLSRPTPAPTRMMESDETTNGRQPESADAPPGMDSDGPRWSAAAQGLMLVNGYVTVSEEGLGRLINDERIFLLDVTALEIQQRAGIRAENVVSPSPYWSMDWGEPAQ